MQQNPRLNPHGVAGILFIVLMFGIAFFLNWNINWWYFVPAVVLYSWAVISLTRAEEQISEEEIPEERLSAEWLISRCLLACHLTLLFLAGGLLLHFQDYTYRPFFGDSAVISVGFLTVGYFIASIFAGLVVPFLLLRISEHYRINPHGLFAMLLIVLLFRIAFFYIWNINWIYFVVTIAICYIGGIFLNFYLAEELLPSPLRRRRVLLGWYITCIFLVGGFGLHFKDGGIALSYFIASIAGGLAIPRLLYRGSK